MKYFLTPNELIIYRSDYTALGIIYLCYSIAGLTVSIWFIVLLMRCRRCFIATRTCFQEHWWWNCDGAKGWEGGGKLPWKKHKLKFYRFPTSGFCAADCTFYNCCFSLCPNLNHDHKFTSSVMSARKREIALSGNNWKLKLCCVPTSDTCRNGRLIYAFHFLNYPARIHIIAIKYMTTVCDMRQ